MNKGMLITEQKTKKIIKKVELPNSNGAYQKCLYWFFSYPDRVVSLNELSHVLRISKTNTRKIVLMMVKEGFLFKEELGKVWRIFCNKQHPYNFSTKIGFNLQMIYRSGIVDDIYKIIPGAKAIMLFGSYRKGDDIETSDIDLAVEVLGGEGLKIHEFGAIESFGYRKNIPINLYIFSRRKIDLNLFSNIANGIILSGFLEVNP